VEKMLNKEELKMSLKLYKDSLGSERYKVKPEKRVPVEVGQLRNLFWSPNEYVLVYHIEEDGLVHAVPLTVWVSLTTCSTKIYLPEYVKGFPKLYAPLPFHVYIRREILEEEGIPVYKIKPENIEKVLRNVDRSPTWSAIKPIRDFLKLVWKRYEDLTLSSLFYTHGLREGKYDENHNQTP
jgi:hypothetical protein